MDHTLSEIIDAVEKVALKNAWSYPQIFDALKKYGVEKYEADVENQIISYLGRGESAIKRPEGDFSDLTVAKKLAAAAVKKAVARQWKSDDYHRFLREIADAGVCRYVVDMESRTITFVGKDGKECREKIPQAS